MPLELQPKLLRVLEEHRVQPLGAAAPRRVDVRVLAATNAALSDLAGTFRQDLYFRLARFTVQVPPCASAAKTSASWRGISSRSLRWKWASRAPP